MLRRGAKQAYDIHRGDPELNICSLWWYFWISRQCCLVEKGSNSCQVAQAAGVSRYDARTWHLLMARWAPHRFKPCGTGRPLQYSCHCPPQAGSVAYWLHLRPPWIPDPQRGIESNRSVGVRRSVYRSLAHVAWRLSESSRWCTPDAFVIACRVPRSFSGPGPTRSCKSHPPVDRSSSNKNTKET